MLSPGSAVVPPCGTPVLVPVRPGSRPISSSCAGSAGRPMVRRTTVITSSTYGCPWPGLDGVRQAAVDVVLQQQQPDLVGRGGERLDLLQQVEAVGLFLDQPLQPAGLALDPAQPVQELATVLGVRVPEVGRGIGAGCCRHTAGQYADARRHRSIRRTMRHPMTDLEREELIAPLERALVIFSHPDDAEFSAAPTIAALTAAGARVDYVVTTDGGKGTEDPAVTPEQLAATRIAEQRAAADVLGVERDRAPRLSGRLPAAEPGAATRHRAPDPPLSAGPGDRPEPAAPRRRQPVHRPSRSPGHRRGHAGRGLPGGARPPELPGAAATRGWSRGRCARCWSAASSGRTCGSTYRPRWSAGSRRCAATRARSTTGMTVEARVRERAAEVGEPVGMPMAQAFLSILLT